MAEKGSARPKCPTCDASGPVNIGRDGSPRIFAAYITPHSTDPLITKRRERARMLRRRNASSNQ